MMRSSIERVTFRHDFLLKGVDTAQPPGTYEIETDDMANFVECYGVEEVAVFRRVFRGPEKPEILGVVEGQPMGQGAPVPVERPYICPLGIRSDARRQAPKNVNFSFGGGVDHRELQACYEGQLGNRTLARL